MAFGLPTPCREAQKNSLAFILYLLEVSAHHLIEVHLCGLAKPAFLVSTKGTFLGIGEN